MEKKTLLWLLGGAAAAGAAYMLLKKKDEKPADQGKELAALPPITNEAGEAGEKMLSLPATSSSDRGQYGAGGKKRILIVGDSLALGLGKYGFPALADAASMTIGVDAVGGTTLQYWGGYRDNNVDKGDPSLRIAANITNFKPDLVLVSLGTNNAGSAYEPVPIVRQRVKNLLLENWYYAHPTDPSDSYGRRSPRPPLLWVFPPAIKTPKLPHIDAVRYQSAQALDDVQKQIAESGDMNLRGFYSEERDIPLSSDGIHPGPDGYKKWAQFIADFVKEQKILG